MHRLIGQIKAGLRGARVRVNSLRGRHRACHPQARGVTVTVMLVQVPDDIALPFHG